MSTASLATAAVSGARRVRSGDVALLRLYVLRLLFALNFLGSEGGSGLFTVMAGGAIADLIVIPWPYVLDAYIKTPANLWR